MFHQQHKLQLLDYLNIPFYHTPKFITQSVQITIGISSKQGSKYIG